MSIYQYDAADNNENGYVSSKDFAYLSRAGYPQGVEKEITSIYEINNEPLSIVIAHLFRGHIFTEQGWGPIDPTQPDRYRLMNEEGVARFTALIRPFTDKNVMIGDHTIEEIYGICRDIRITIIRMIGDHYEDYGINPTKANMKLILTVIDDLVFPSIKRSFRGGERRHRETIIRLHESSMQREQETKKPTLNPFKLLKQG